MEATIKHNLLKLEFTSKQLVTTKYACFYTYKVQKMEALLWRNLLKLNFTTILYVHIGSRKWRNLLERDILLI